MTHERRKSDAEYKASRKNKGYVRIHKWIPAKFKSTIYPIIDLLACHHEAAASTVEFHGFIMNLYNVAKKIEGKCEVHEDGK